MFLRVHKVNGECSSLKSHYDEIQDGGVHVIEKHGGWFMI